MTRHCSCYDSAGECLSCCARESAIEALVDELCAERGITYEALNTETKIALYDEAVAFVDGVPVTPIAQSQLREAA